MFFFLDKKRASDSCCGFIASVCAFYSFVIRAPYKFTVRASVLRFDAIVPSVSSTSWCIL